MGSGDFFSTGATLITVCWMGDLFTMLPWNDCCSAGNPWHCRRHCSPQYLNPVLLHCAVARCEHVGLEHLPDGPRISFSFFLVLFELVAEIWTKIFELGKEKKERCHGVWTQHPR